MAHQHKSISNRRIQAFYFCKYNNVFTDYSWDNNTSQKTIFKKEKSWKGPIQYLLWQCLQPAVFSIRITVDVGGIRFYVKQWRTVNHICS